MGFKFVETPQFTRDVKVLEPSGDGVEEKILSTTFQVVPEDRDKDYTVDDGYELLSQRVVSFNDLVDEGGAKIEFNDVVKAALLKRPYIRMALMQAYVRANYEEKAGN